MTHRTKRRLGWILAGVFAVAFFCGTGPGILLVNQPESIELAGVKLPWIYGWGLLWYAVEAACVVLACFLVWNDDCGED